MADKKQMKFGEIAFIIGVVLAILGGIFSNFDSGWITLVLVVLGLVVSFLNISEKETTPFLIAAIALLVTGTAGASLAVIPWGIGPVLSNIVQKIAVFVAPGAIVVSIKAIMALAKD